MKVIDLRSDTVTRPSAAMRAAIAEAEVGDDVFGDDPTVNRLEAVAADRVGKEAAVFVASGTMANLIGVMTNTRPGDEILLGDQSHIFNYEVAGSARIANVQAHALPNADDGSLDVVAVAAAIRPPNIHAPRTSLLCLENTHNRCGGAAIDVETIDGLAAVAHENGARVHLDGARLFNAAAALRLGAERLAQECDTVSFCFSKGLGAPVGSVLCGSNDFVTEARRNRKLLGGGMRQAGILAAAALYALDHNVSRLEQDHANAQRLAEGLRDIGPFAPNEPQTNIVIADVLQGDLDSWLAAFAAAGVLAVPFGPARFRMVTHLDIQDSDIPEALARVAQAVGAHAAA
ncbi:low-specificity L-threonine aldolase [bacterium]|nr:low-specificity L-threonine aldolase [bacterium]